METGGGHMGGGALLPSLPLSLSLAPPLSPQLTAPFPPTRPPYALLCGPLRNLKWGCQCGPSPSSVLELKAQLISSWVRLLPSTQSSPATSSFEVLHFLAFYSIYLTKQVFFVYVIQKENNTILGKSLLFK